MSWFFRLYYSTKCLFCQYLVSFLQNIFYDYQLVYKFIFDIKGVSYNQFRISKFYKYSIFTFLTDNIKSLPMVYCFLKWALMSKLNFDLNSREVHRNVYLCGSFTLQMKVLWNYSLWPWTFEISCPWIYGGSFSGKALCYPLGSG